MSGVNSQGLNQHSSQEEAVMAMNAIKAELTEQINRLSELKKDVI